MEGKSDLEEGDSREVVSALVWGEILLLPLKH